MDGAKQKLTSFEQIIYQESWLSQIKHPLSFVVKSSLAELILVCGRK